MLRIKGADAKETGHYLMERWRQMQQDRSGWLEKRIKLRGRVDGQVPERPRLFAGQCNFTPPISKTFLLLFLARAYKGLLEADPSDYLVAQNNYGSILRDKVKPYLKGRFIEGEWREYVREWFENAAQDGVSVLWLDWDESAVPRVEVLDRFSHPRLVGPEVPVDQIMKDVLLQEFEWVVETLEMTGPLTAKVLARHGTQSRIGTITISDIVGTSAIFEWDFDELKSQARLDVCDIEKIVWSSKTKRPDREGVVARQVGFTWAKLQALADAGEVTLPSKEEAGEWLGLHEPAVAGAPPEAPADESQTDLLDLGIEAEREEARGVVEMYASALSDEVPVLQFIAPWDYRGDGSVADCIFWVLPKCNQCIRAEPLYRRYRGGKRPLAFLWYGKKDGRAEGQGIPWLVETIEDELHAIHSMAGDAAIWSMSVFGFYRQNAQNTNVGSMAVEPWVFLPMADPEGDVKIITVNPNFQVGLQMEMFLMQLARDLIGVSEQSYGRPPKRARGVYDTLALMQESNIRFDYIIEQWAESLSRVFSIWWDMEQQFAPADVTVTVPGVGGVDGFVKAPPKKDLAKCQFAVRFEVNPSALNPSLQKQSQQLLLSTLTSPVMLQLGMVDRGNIYNAMEDFITAMGRHDVSRYVNRPPEAIAKRYSPDAEWLALLNGEEIRVSSMDDDEAHLTDHVGRDSSVLSPPQIQRWMIHMQGHERQQQSKQIAVQLAMMQQQGGGGSKEGVVQPPAGGGAKNPDPLAQRDLADSSSQAGGVSPATGATPSLEPEQVTLPSGAGTGA
ncbi:hypothetical protein KKH13_04285 [Patescibacteria group bacterium]|nr:hypothetical protein [Patescibacteria group bacterium]